MPRAGSEWTTITISKNVYEKIKQAMIESNEEAGYRKFRSISHFVEHTVMNYEEGSEIKGGWRQYYDKEEINLEKLRKTRPTRQNKTQTRRKS